MTVIQNQEIEGQSFILEEVSFINCKLTKCHLFYSGGDFEWVNTTFVECGFHFRGSAKNTESLFRSLGLMKAGTSPAPSPMSKAIQ